MGIPFSKRLDVRLTIIVCIILTVFSVIAGIFTYNYSYRHQLELAGLQQLQIVRTIQAQAEVAAFAGNATIGKEVLDGLLANPVILAARIESTDGFKVELGSRNKVSFSTGNIYPLFSPVGHIERIGTLVVVQNDGQINNTAGNAAAFQTMLLLLQILITTILMLAVLRIVLTRPITRLAQALKAVKPGSAERIEIDKKHAQDEIGILANSANALLNTAENAIHEIDRKSEQITKSLSLLQATLESTNDAILVVDMNNTWVLYNQRFVDLWHITDEIIAAKDDSAALSYVLNQLENADGFVNKVRELYAAPEANSFDLIYFKDGKIIERYSIPQLIDGKVVGRVWSFHDATERKLAEHGLRESMHQLEEKELAKTRFLAAAGHDLRQPLAAANLFIDALKFTDPTPNQNQIIQRLDQAMINFNGQLDALLNISKLDAGVIKPEYSLVDVAEIFKQLEQSFASVAGNKQLELKMFIPKRERLFVHTDIGLINSVLMNLVSNAIKYTLKGTILVSARRRGDNVLLQVWDTGIGIKAEHLEHIFDEFYQINNPQRDRTSGLGLGLSIAKRAISLLGGRISCRSQIGRGSVFEFRLPLEKSRSRATPQATTNVLLEDVNPAGFVQGKHFIVVEDDTLVAEAICNALVMMGGKVECFHNAEDALCYPLIEQADAYIVDYMLGVTLNGIQFLNQLRRKLDNPINAVIMTGDTSPSFIRETADCDWPVLHKPVNISKLVSSLSLQAR